VRFEFERFRFPFGLLDGPGLRGPLRDFRERSDLARRDGPAAARRRHAKRQRRQQLVLAVGLAHAVFPSWPIFSRDRTAGSTSPPNRSIAASTWECAGPPG